MAVLRTATSHRFLPAYDQVLAVGYGRVHESSIRSRRFMRPSLSFDLTVIVVLPDYS